MSNDEHHAARELSANYLRRYLRLLELRRATSKDRHGRKGPDHETELFLISALHSKGYSRQEIASILGCGLGAVERKLRLIRTIWGEEDER